MTNYNDILHHCYLSARTLRALQLCHQVAVTGIQRSAMPTSWPEDLSTLTSEELAVLHRANEEWFTDLKLRVQLLTDGKTVGVIGEDNFARSMKCINKD